MRRALRIGAFTVAVAFLVFISNYLPVGRPVSHALAEDSRNSALSLAAHHRFYLLPSSLVLRLSAAGEASPADIWRAFFTAADALHERGTTYSEVRLVHGMNTVYTLSGEDFAEIGRERGADENPVYMIRTLPEKLRKPSGEPAFYSGGGGIFGVGEEIKNASAAALAWAGLEQ